ncbi:flavin-containing monooxygenase [Sphaerimonospora thailandensis]|uniref:Cyclohexanone monooxygenase n=1 Tax=Sphaerimonospora thailandensis TaxID=795644 RepID=A0A8J3R458_9ACTN|nr:NAD(P)/FAD-dependent oxidoreductase [Sphaerimonospora thailandensis]GIH68080.1 cyclohexanone monooxygenase [Sphaerimonospora thailandensis]
MESARPITGAEYDVVVIGAGFSGLYALYRLRDLNAKVICFEAGDGVGGTWYWNRYPGARVDIESMQYSYSFDEDLQQEWRWPEHYSPQPDLEAYANHVADRFDLRERIRFGARVNRLRFDEAANRWHVRTDRGDQVVAKYVLAAAGSLNAENIPQFPGLDSFQGQWYHTANWPREEVDFTGKRVGLIGTGSTGIQVAPVVAETAGHLHVFQRTPNFSLPSKNRPLEPEYEREWKENYTERRAAISQDPGAVYWANPADRSIFEFTPEEREQILNKAWGSKGGFEFIRCFRETMVNLEANEIVAEFVRNKIRQTVKDQTVAELLCPKTYPFGTKRLCLDTGYYETFNRENVTLVDVRSDPITEITPTGLKTTAAAYDLDIIIFATGFDAMTGAMTRMNVTGVDGMDLRDKWRDGPTSYLGYFVAGFPNLFMIHGPGSPSVLAQMITSGEAQVDWVVEFIEHMEENGYERVDTTSEWEDNWSAEVNVVADYTLYKKADSWYLGANIAGKPRVFMVYVGGFDRYVQRCNEQVEAGYEGFVLSR